MKLPTYDISKIKSCYFNTAQEALDMFGDVALEIKQLQLAPRVGTIDNETGLPDLVEVTPIKTVKLILVKDSRGYRYVDEVELQYIREANGTYLFNEMIREFKERNYNNYE